MSQPQSRALECARPVLPQLWRHRERQGELEQLPNRSSRRPAPKWLGVLRRLRPAPDQEHLL